jgi:hypothetical protein
MRSRRSIKSSRRLFAVFAPFRQAVVAATFDPSWWRAAELTW